MFAGKDFTPAVIDEVQKDSPAEVAGMQKNDVIIEIDNNNIIDELTNLNICDQFLDNGIIAPKNSSRKNHRQDQSILTMLIYKNGLNNLITKTFKYSDIKLKY